MLHGLDIFLIDGACRVRALLLAKVGSLLDVIVGRAVKSFFEDRLLVLSFELGLEVGQGLSGGVAAAAFVGEFIAVVLSLVG